MCMKNRGLGMPTYFDSSEGQAHCLHWTTVCEVNRKKFVGSGYSKMESQQSASKLALTALSKVTTSSKEVKKPLKQPKPIKITEEEPDLWSPSDLGGSEDEWHSSSSEPPLTYFPIPSISSRDTKVSKKKVVIVDLENIPSFPSDVEDILSQLEGKLDMFTVSSKHSSIKIPFPKRHIFTPSMNQNAADMCIVMLIGMFLGEDKYEEYFIATRDKFIIPVIECGMSGTTPKIFNPRPMHVVSKREHLVELLGS